ncbi:MAG: CPBP family intramembrane metalloprotease [Sphingomonadales bacterium]|nr:CPBP family intramembrane metalloprotease [Sphingomonadales bacterium]MDE2569633.1 CPBP family intramembrane metalloprotease [Sphingomonadales bacterium]
MTRLFRKALGFHLVQLVVEAVVIVAVAVLFSTLAHKFPLGRNTPALFGGAVVTAAGIVLAWKGCRRWIERSADREFPLAGMARELPAGLAFGFLLFSGMAGIVALLGGFEVLGVRGAGQIWSMLAMAVISGTFEETLFRGIIYRHLEGLLGSIAALAITSTLFGAAHLANPGATWFAALAIAVEAGILLGAAYMLTRTLWLAAGLHAAWNFTQGWVFSVPVSGGEAPLGLLVTRRIGPEWLTGGDFGLEASAVAMVVATLAGLAMLEAARRKGRLVSLAQARGKVASG